MRALVRVESWPIRGGFRIARGARAAADVVVVELHDQGCVGRAECVPYTRYGESIESVRSQIEAGCRGLKGANARAQALSMPAGAARNAIDCALWDLEAKRAGKPAWELAGLRGPSPDVHTMRTVSVDTAEKMKAAAHALADARTIKVKVDGGADLDRIAAVHEGAPKAELVVDANEAWSADQLVAWLPLLPKLGVTVLEQPLPADEDAALDRVQRAVLICADETFHDRLSFSSVEGRYDMVNIKLDKTGGLTEALYCVGEARRLGLQLMIGCMVSTSLAIEPALLLASDAEYVDLDGPLLLKTDRADARHERESGLLRSSSAVWGAA
ncbi:MAG: dipeptide epimerase [Deltaproteobacteria bacterium]|nr:dipeptide epimerase [Deltaproteobacteria bacterium]MBW2213166.1 dipeptide epimerase [Deltaproteobacteria bacterium]MBW2378440.1 dipeptide epimerase [Deltaproteobacteria bacterium]MBW2627652.1 dipeptide epimerase [Deltaproteobacteria bacterium]MBW2684781.1 dipeptide epimerase [Deltaproteobacteria bacterium]